MTDSGDDGNRGFAAVVDLELIEMESLFKTNCSYVLDQMIPAPSPVRVDW